jgi:hypothetical protein
MSHFVVKRQEHLVSTEHSKTTQASTILITAIPKKYLSEAVLTQLFSTLPGGVKKV